MQIRVEVVQESTEAETLGGDWPELQVIVVKLRPSTQLPSCGDVAGPRQRGSEIAFALDSRMLTSCSG